MLFLLQMSLNERKVLDETKNYYRQVADAVDQMVEEKKHINSSSTVDEAWENKTNKRIHLNNFDWIRRGIITFSISTYDF